MRLAHLNAVGTVQDVLYTIHRPWGFRRASRAPLIASSVFSCYISIIKTKHIQYTRGHHLTWMKKKNQKTERQSNERVRAHMRSDVHSSHIWDGAIASVYGVFYANRERSAVDFVRNFRSFRMRRPRNHSRHRGLVWIFVFFYVFRPIEKELRFCEVQKVLWAIQFTWKYLPGHCLYKVCGLYIVCLLRLICI